MENEKAGILFDIVEGCRLIEEFVAGYDLERYASDELVRSAVERQFINIGEALNRLKQVDIGIFSSITDASQIVGFRNVLVHGYDVVSDELVWEIIVQNLP